MCVRLRSGGHCAAVINQQGPAANPAIPRSPADLYPAHMKVVGNNAFWLYGCANAWIRNVRKMQLGRACSAVHSWAAHPHSPTAWPYPHVTSPHPRQVHIIDVDARSPR